MAKKSKQTRGQQRSVRIQQIIFIIIGVMIILSMVLALVSK